MAICDDYTVQTVAILRKVAQSRGIKYSGLKKAALVSSLVEYDRKETESRMSNTNEMSPVLDGSVNLGYEGKLAKRLSCYLAGIDVSEAKEQDLAESFARMATARETMVVGAKVSGSAQCALCGKRGAKGPHAVTFCDDNGSDVELIVGACCLNNLPYIRGRGDALERKRDAVWLEEKALYESGSMSKEQKRRYKIRRAHRVRLGETV
jgi:hypothetical protein